MRQVESNFSQEITGYKGSLPDSEKDIFCKEQGGPDYKMNYWKSSCKERQAQNTCKRVNCHRFTAPIPTKEQLRAAVKSNEGRIKCACCGQLGKNEGRQLISACYKRHKNAGTLEQFKKVGRKGSKYNKVKK